MAKKNRSSILPIKIDGALSDIVNSLVASGFYSSKAEAIRAGIRLLEKEHKDKFKK